MPLHPPFGLLLVGNGGLNLCGGPCHVICHLFLNPNPKPYGNKNNIWSAEALQGKKSRRSGRQQLLGGKPRYADFLDEAPAPSSMPRDQGSQQQAGYITPFMGCINLGSTSNRARWSSYWEAPYFGNSQRFQMHLAQRTFRYLLLKACTVQRKGASQ